MNDNQGRNSSCPICSANEEIIRLEASYRKTAHQITSGTLPNTMTNIGDKQAWKLRRIQQLKLKLHELKHL